MSTIFSEKCYKLNEIPSPDSYAQIISLVHKVITRSPVSAITGACFVSSIIGGNQGSSSDVDLVVTHKNNIGKVAEILRQIVLEAAKLFVPFDYIPINEKLKPFVLEKYIGTHFQKVIEYFYLNGGKIRGNVTRSFPNQGSFKNCALTYFAHKSKKLSTALIAYPSMSTDERMDILGDTLHSVTNGVRIFLAARGNELAEVLSADKKKLLIMYEGEGRKWEVSHFQKVINIQKEYNDLLNEPTKDLRTYSMILKEITKMIPNTIDFLETNFDHLG